MIHSKQHWACRIQDPLSFPRGGVDCHLLNPKLFVASHYVVVAKPPPKSAAQSIPVESGEHVQEFGSSYPLSCLLPHTELWDNRSIGLL